MLISNSSKTISYKNLYNTKISLKSFNIFRFGFSGGMSSFNSSVSGKSPLTSPKSSVSSTRSSLLGRSLELPGNRVPRVEVTSFDDEVVTSPEVFVTSPRESLEKQEPLQEQNVNENISVEKAEGVKQS